MKKLPVFLVICIGMLQGLQAQSLEERLSRHKPSCTDVFSNAMDVLPEFYKAKAFDSVQLVIGFIEKNCDNTVESFDLQLLLDIQQQRFTPENSFDSISINNLSIRANRYHFHNQYSRSNLPDQNRYYDFTAGWANDLLKRKDLSANETLVLKVMAGEEKQPFTVVRKNSGEYPYFYKLLHASERAERNAPQLIAAITAGAWVPTNNLAALGTHPSVGFLIGTRNKRNEFTVNLNFKFLKAANEYTIMRQNTLYPSTHFFGGYIGLDYIRYLLMNTKVELGWLAGAGYDGFDVANSDNHNNDHLKPLSIGSLNLNTGLRFNYFFKNSSFIGLAARYNGLDYKNKDATSFKGDSFSIYIIVGSSSRKRNTY